MPHSLRHVGQPSTTSTDYFGAIAHLLRALCIQEVAYSLDGGGDSGEAEIDRVVYCDGREELKLPAVPVAISPTGQIQMLDGYLEGHATDKPDGDWVNNEGGYGTVTILPFETEPEEMIDCDMTYRAEGDYGDDDCDDDDLDPIDLDISDNLNDESLVIEIVMDGEARP